MLWDHKVQQDQQEKMELMVLTVLMVEMEETVEHTLDFFLRTVELVDAKHP